MNQRWLLFFKQSLHTQVLPSEVAEITESRISSQGDRRKRLVCILHLSTHTNTNELTRYNARRLKLTKLCLSRHTQDFLMGFLAIRHFVIFTNLFSVDKI